MAQAAVQSTSPMGVSSPVFAYLKTDTPSTAADIPAPKANPVASADALAKRCQRYLSTADVNKIREAFRYADEAHLGQLRNSGEPYITHPIAVAEILASWHLDAAAIEAGLMHDVLEDTAISKREMSERFGIEVAELVDGVSKLDKLQFSSNEEAQAESFYKMLLAMSRDVRVILIKLADRIHNMRTLGAVKQHKKFRIAKETMEIYVPIANRLGLYSVYRELSDTSFSYMYPLRHMVLKKAVERSRERRKTALEQVRHEVSDALSSNKIRADVQDKNKGLWRIYLKMRERHIKFNDVLDVHSFRINVPHRIDCYRALGVIHSIYKPVPGKFKDFVAIPKPNGYQGLHTTVLGPKGLPIEFQIRTEDMHYVCEYGITAHWLYRNRGNSQELQKATQTWLESLLEIQRQSGTSLEFMENLKVDISPDRVYIFTPKGKIIQLPKHSTAVDFAYQIHSDVGNHCIGCKINGEPALLSRELRNGEVIEILTGPTPSPNPQWLSTVRTGRARAEIRQYLRQLSRQGSIDLGMKLIENVAEQQRLPLSQCDEDDWERVCKSNEVNSKDDLLAEIGYGKKDPTLVLHQLTSQVNLGKADFHTETAPILNLQGRKYHLAPCCTPVPYDQAIGHFIAATNTLHIHRTDCTHTQRGFRVDPENWQDVKWNPEHKELYSTKLDIEITETHSTLEKITSEVARLKSSINGFSMTELNPQVSRVHVTVQVTDTTQLRKIINALRAIETVRFVSRHIESDHRMKPVDVEEDI